MNFDEEQARKLELRRKSHLSVLHYSYVGTDKIEMCLTGYGQYLVRFNGVEQIRTRDAVEANDTFYEFFKISH